MKALQLLTLILLFILTACEKPTDGQSINYELGEPTLAGQACEHSTAFLSEDGKEVIVDLTDITLSAGGPYRSLMRSSCTLAVPFTVPAGHQVAIVPAVLSGSTDLKENAKLGISMHTFIAGKEGVITKQDIEQAGTQTFKLGGYRDLDKVEFSKCGEDITLRVNFSAFLKTKNKEEESFAKLSSLSNDKGGAFTLIFKSCEKK